MSSVILASTSPSRLSILGAAGITPQVVAPGVDEDAVVAAARPADVPAQAELLAAAKGDAVLEAITAGRIVPAGEEDRHVLLASDSILELDGLPVGKPHTPERTRDVWRSMGGRTAVLYTGHLVAVLEPSSALSATTSTDGPSAPGAGQSTSAPGGWTVTARETAVLGTTVTMARLDDAELEAYIATGEPLEVAGALTIDGYGGAFVESLTGDHLNVLGLSLPLVRRLLNKHGIAWHTLWDAYT